MLFGKKEPSNGVDKNAIAVICLNSCGREEVVGQVSQNISKVVPLCFSLCQLLPGTVVMVVMDLAFRQGFVLMGLKRPRSG